jgi:hypothetical protein
MMDKKLVYTLLIVLLIVFVSVAIFTVKQWKQLSLPEMIISTTPKATPKARNAASVMKPAAALQLLPSAYNPKLVVGPLEKAEQKKEEGCGAPKVKELPTPLYKKPEQVEEPNLNCSPLNTFAPRVGREYVLYADSACRNFEMFPTSQYYYYKLPTPMYNVQAVDIIQAMIPRGEDLINVNNDTFYIQEGTNAPVAVTMETADYLTDALFAVEITSKLNAAGLANTYLVTALLNKLIFTRTGGVLPFQLLFTQEFDPYQLVRQALGFPPTSVPDVGGVIYAPFKTVLHAIRFVEVVSPEVSRNFTDNPVMARIPLLGGFSQDVTEYDPATIGTRTYWPIERLMGITLQFFVGPSCPPRSVLYNFNGLENSLTLKFTSYEYKNIFIDEYCIEHMS